MDETGIVYNDLERSQQDNRNKKQIEHLWMKAHTQHGMYETKRNQNKNEYWNRHEINNGKSVRTT